MNVRQSYSKPKVGRFFETRYRRHVDSFVQQNVTISARLDDVSNAWQWREGRLLAYELIFQFLIKNHLLYTFGTAQPSTSPDDRGQPGLQQTW